MLSIRTFSVFARSRAVIAYWSRRYVRAACAMHNSQCTWIDWCVNDVMSITHLKLKLPSVILKCACDIVLIFCIHFYFYFCIVAILAGLGWPDATCFTFFMRFMCLTFVCCVNIESIGIVADDVSALRDVIHCHYGCGSQHTSIKYSLHVQCVIAII